MSACEKFKKLGYKRKRNNKEEIKYVLVDENYLSWAKKSKDDSKMERHIRFNKKRKTVELKEICYTFNIVHQKRISYINEFVVNEELLVAINEQFAELKTKK